MTTCIIAEKPSVARDIARIVGATTKQDGYLAGNDYLVTWAMGHLITLAMPEAYGIATYKAEDLPIRPNPFRLIVRQVRKENFEKSRSKRSATLMRGCINLLGFRESICPEPSPRDSKNEVPGNLLYE